MTMNRTIQKRDRAERRLFNTRKRAEAFASSLGNEWYARVYEGHRSYVVQFYKKQTSAPVVRNPPEWCELREDMIKDAKEMTKETGRG